MEQTFYNGLKLGVLGGGQLGRMLIQEAINLNIEVHSLDPDPNAPCKHIATSFTQGALSDYDTVLNFGSQFDILTIEIEHVNIEALKELEKQGVLVFPQPAALEIVQDKGLQKLHYQNNQLPTSDFRLIESPAEIKPEDLPIVQKMRKGGYDGKGVQVLRTPEDIKEKAFDVPSVLETLVPIDKEISVIVARNKSGEVKCFPSVEMEFNEEANLVEFLVSPAHVTPEQEKEAEQLAIKVIESLDMIGILAVEMFINKDGKILINEIAPRPHNSGHQTIEGNYTSQYAQHLRSIFNLPLGNPSIKAPSVMINVLGEKGFTGDAIYENVDEVLASSGAFIHLYGKKQTKPFRKMGHITVVDQDRTTAIEKARKIKNILKVKA